MSGDYLSWCKCVNLNLTLLIKVIQGQDNSDNDLFGSVVMSNVCGCTLDS